MNANLSRFVRITISLVLIAYLLWSLLGQSDVVRFSWRSVNGNLLAAALALNFLAVLITLVRWWLLVRAVGVDLRLGESVRYGLLGYAFSVVSIGTIAGDAYRAAVAARRSPEQRAVAILSVVVDRMIGLLSLAVVACCGVAVAWGRILQPELREVAAWGIAITALGTVCLAALVGYVARADAADCDPTSGGVASRFRQIVDAFRMYCRQGPVVLTALGLAIFANIASVLAFWLLASALFGHTPSLPTHLAVVPTAILTTSLPLPCSGLGAFELTLSQLYAAIPDEHRLSAAEGLLVAFGYRGLSITIAVVGFLCAARYGIAWGRTAARLPAAHDSDTTGPDVRTDSAQITIPDNRCLEGVVT